MGKQLLIYETAVPITPARHGKHSVDVDGNYTFSAGVNAVPLMAVEILRAATEYAVVFTAVGDDVMPAVVLGVKGDQNLYLGPDGHWNAKYIPAFIRRYPFVFAASADNKTLTLCIDEAYPGLNTAGSRPAAVRRRRPPHAVRRSGAQVPAGVPGALRADAGARPAPEGVRPARADARPRSPRPAASNLSLTGFMACEPNQAARARRRTSWRCWPRPTSWNCSTCTCTRCATSTK